MYDVYFNYLNMIPTNNLPFGSMIQSIERIPVTVF